MNEDSKEKEFQAKTKDSYDEFVSEIRARGFCMVDAICRWLETIANYWQENLPKNILDCFLTIYEFYS